MGFVVLSRTAEPSWQVLVLSAPVRGEPSLRTSTGGTAGPAVPPSKLLHGSSSAQPCSPAHQNTPSALNQAQPFVEAGLQERPTTSLWMDPAFPLWCSNDAVWFLAFLSCHTGQLGLLTSVAGRPEAK